MHTDCYILYYGWHNFGRSVRVLGLLALILFEVERDTVHTMSLVRGSLVSLSLEDMPEVTTADGQSTRRTEGKRLTN